MLYRAIEKTGRPIVISLSPGPAHIDRAWFYGKYANMWRITDDLWDDWELLKEMFGRCEMWQDHVKKGCYPDCDMLPLGYIGKGVGRERKSGLTKEEQRTMMTPVSYTHLKIRPTLKINSVITVGFSSGSVILLICCHLVAPSIIAAS